jgi:hypothetical protein
MSRVLQVKEAQRVLMLEKRFYRLTVNQYEQLDELGIVGGRLELLDGELGRDGYVVKFDADELQKMYQHDIVNTELELIDGALYHTSKLTDETQNEIKTIASYLEQILGECIVVRQRPRLMLSAQNVLIPDIVVQRKPNNRFSSRAATIGDTSIVIDLGMNRSDTEKDLRLEKYAASQLTEVWWLNTSTDIRVYRDTSDQQWGSIFPAQNQNPFSPLEFPDIQIRWW